jgi:hypothetical protein
MLAPGLLYPGALTGIGKSMNQDAEPLDQLDDPPPPRDETVMAEIREILTGADLRRHECRITALETALAMAMTRIEELAEYTTNTTPTPAAGTVNDVKTVENDETTSA